VNSVDNSPVSLAVWCPHVLAKGMFIGADRTSLMLRRGQDPVHIVVEEGKVKLMCTSCYMKAMQLPVTTV
jgi:ferric-dicitrate binding protein FerR (iron transport regulator)